MFVSLFSFNLFGPCLCNVCPMFGHFLSNVCPIIVYRSICPMQQKGTPPIEKDAQVPGIVIIFCALLKCSENKKRKCEQGRWGMWVQQVAWVGLVGICWIALVIIQSECFRTLSTVGLIWIIFLNIWICWPWKQFHSFKRVVKTVEVYQKNYWPIEV